MQQQGVLPDTQTVNSLINAFAKVALCTCIHTGMHTHLRMHVHSACACTYTAHACACTHPVHACACGHTACMCTPSTRRVTGTCTCTRHALGLPSRTALGLALTPRPHACLRLQGAPAHPAIPRLDPLQVGDVERAFRVAASMERRALSPTVVTYAPRTDLARAQIVSRSCPDRAQIVPRRHHHLDTPTFFSPPPPHSKPHSRSRPRPCPRPHSQAHPRHE